MKTIHSTIEACLVEKKKTCTEMQYNRDIASEGKRTLKERIKPLKAACSNKDFSDVYTHDVEVVEDGLTTFTSICYYFKLDLTHKGKLIFFLLIFTYGCLQ